MNTKRANLIFLFIVILAAALTTMHGKLPKRSFSLIPGNDVDALLFSKPLRDGSPSGIWIDKAGRSFKCIFEQENIEKGLFCSYATVIYPKGVMYQEPISGQINSSGVDLSAFDQVIFDVEYVGPARSIRIFLRNFSDKYSLLSDGNSTKFNATLVDTASLNESLVIPISKFMVSDWWLASYKIPQTLADVEFNNIVSFGIDFAEVHPPLGEHTFRVKQVSFEGNYISKERWYLVILYSVIATVFIYVSLQLIQLYLQSQKDLKVIEQLNEKNKHLLNESDRFRKLSTVDSLTNTYNRFGVDQIINTLVFSNFEARTNRNAPLYSLIIIDIDHFKRVNDTYGHDVGDRVLQKVALAIKNVVRPQDFVARWGGEEFVVILPHTAEEFAFAIAEKIRTLIAQDAFESDNKVIVTVSAGVGEQAPNEEFPSSFKRVDTALYKAKNEGRNRSYIAEHNPKI